MCKARNTEMRQVGYVLVCRSDPSHCVFPGNNPQSADPERNSKTGHK